MTIFIELGETEEMFRKAAMKKFGYSKGAIRSAAKEAFVMWCDQNASLGLKKVDDPVGKLLGIAKGYGRGKSSVQLQHEAWDGVIRKAKARG